MATISTMPSCEAVRHGARGRETRIQPGRMHRDAREEMITGNPDPKHVSTSYAERQNLTMRMQMRRFTRLTNAFSKKFENHVHMVALYTVWYNFVRACTRRIGCRLRWLPGSPIGSGAWKISPRWSRPPLRNPAHAGHTGNRDKHRDPQTRHSGCSVEIEVGAIVARHLAPRRYCGALSPRGSRDDAQPHGRSRNVSVR